MKTAFSCFCGALLLAAPVAQGQFGYTTNDGAITVTNYTGSGGVVTISNFVTSIGDDAFRGRSSLTSIGIPDSVTNIGAQAFAFCSALTNVNLGEGVTTIGFEAFIETRLTNIVIPASVTDLESSSLAAGLQNITVEANNPFYSSINGVLFDAGQTTLLQFPLGRTGSYTIPSGPTSIGTIAFGFAAVTSVLIPASVTNIGEGAFEGSDLTNATMTDGLISIGVNAFYNCLLTNMTLPGTVTSIGSNAFTEDFFVTFAIPASVTNMDPDVFYQCTDLTSITVDPQNQYYSSLNGVLFDKTQSTLVEFPPGLSGKYTISGSVPVRGSYSIPDGVINIGPLAFDSCESLTNVTIPPSVTDIGAGAFQGIPYMFNLTIPASVTNIGDQAFLNGLTTLYFEGNPPTLGQNDFYLGGQLAVYYLPGATGWGSSFGGAPAFLWNPAIQTTDGSFGVATNQFGFNVTGTASIPIKIEACTNLASPAWSLLTNVTLTNGVFYFSDPHWTNFPGRFYRIRSE